MSADGVAIHRQPLWKPGWRALTSDVPTPESFPSIIYITMICSESSDVIRIRYA